MPPPIPSVVTVPKPLRINGWGVPGIFKGGLSVTPQVGGAQRRSPARTLLPDRRGVKRQWDVQAKLLGAADAATLRGWLSGLGDVWHFDTDAYSSKGLGPMAGAVYTLRPAEGKFSGAVAVEPATTNLIGANSDFQTGWTASGGATITVTGTQDDPDGGTAAYRIQTSGGSNTDKYDSPIMTSTNAQDYTDSVWVKVNSATDVIVDNGLGNSQTVTQADGWVWVNVSGTGDGVSGVGLKFFAGAAGDSLDFTVYHPQVEAKAYATSYTASTRNAGQLSFTNPLQRKGTLAFWWRKNTTNAAAFQMPFRLANNTFEANIEDTDINVSDNGEVLHGTIAWNPGEWHHAVYTWDPDAAIKRALYFDGAQVATTATAPSDPSEQAILNIGHDGAAGNIFDGQFDGLIWLPRAASADEIAAWYAYGHPFGSLPRLSIDGDAIEDGPVDALADLEPHADYVPAYGDALGQNITFRLLEV